MTLAEGPYAAAATTYFGRGVGSPLPVPPRMKKSPPSGYTGYQGLWPSYADVIDWATNGRGLGNVVLRLAETVIGIDVDAYGEKHGDEELARLEAELGALPSTFVSTSRPLPSGIRFYRVPAGRCWADIAGPGIEVIHWGHRYAVVAPSIHPDTGAQYVWLRDGVVVAGPSLDDLPLLPEAWVRFLDRGPVSERSTKAAVDSDSVAAMLAEYPGGEACPWIEKVLDEAVKALETPASRHDTVRRYVALLVRAGEQGHTGARPALTSLYQAFRDALDRGEKRLPDYGEYERMVEGAVALVLDSPTAEVDKGCCGSDPGPDLSFDPGPGLDAFWSARPVLTHIHTYARAQVVSPWAVLGVVLARMVTRVRHEVVLPKTIGSWGSLNLFVALVGDSGTGKGAAEGVAEDAVKFGQHIDTVGVGSGEGICHFYAHREKQQVIRDKYACLFTVQEVDTLSALGGRQGATLLPELRKAWSGEQLGMLYSDPAKRLPIARHSYRLCLVLGVQPLRAEGLLADTGGTPQRFVWLPAGDRGLPDVAPVAPTPWVWPGIEGAPIGNPDGVQPMIVCQQAVDVILEARRARMRGDHEALDGHALFCRLKVAAALALLDSRYEVNEKDWELAGMVMVVSSRTRDSIQAQLQKAVTERNEARAASKGREAVIVSETVSGSVTARCREKVLGLVTGDEWTPYRELRNGVSRKQREVLGEVLGDLLVEKILQKREDGEGHYYRCRK